MSITKTPKQIAAEIVNDNTAPDEWSPILMAEVAALVVAGIEADRMQREEEDYQLVCEAMWNADPSVPDEDKFLEA